MKQIFVLLLIISFVACSSANKKEDVATNQETTPKTENSKPEPKKEESKPATTTSVKPEANKREVTVNNEPTNVDLSLFDEVGFSTYIGKQYHGKQTASGEIYDKNKLTAAHKNIPFGSIVKIQNLENNKETLVKINDRGPYVDTRIIDVSEKTAEVLNYNKEGVTKVGIKVVESKDKKNLVDKEDDYNFDFDEDEDSDDDLFDSKDKKETDSKKSSTPKKDDKKSGKVDATKETPKDSKDVKKETKDASKDSTKDVKKTESKETPKIVSNQPKGFTVQLGALKSEKNANSLKDKAEKITSEKVYIFTRNEQFVIQVGDFTEKEKALELANKLKEKGLSGFVPKN